MSTAIVQIDVTEKPADPVAFVKGLLAACPAELPWTSVRVAGVVDELKHGRRQRKELP